MAKVTDIAEAKVRVAVAKSKKLNVPLQEQAFARIWGTCLKTLLALKKRTPKLYGKEEATIRLDVYKDLQRRFRQFGLPMTEKEVAEWPVQQNLVEQLQKDVETSERQSLPVNRAEVYVLIGLIVHAVETEQVEAVFAMTKHDGIEVAPEHRSLFLKRLAIELNRYTYRCPDQFDAQHERVRWQVELNEIPRAWRRLRTWAISGIDHEEAEEEEAPKEELVAAVEEPKPKPKRKPKPKKKAKEKVEAMTECKPEVEDFDIQEWHEAQGEEIL